MCVWDVMWCVVCLFVWCVGCNVLCGVWDVMWFVGCNVLWCVCVCVCVCGAETGRFIV